MPDRKSFLATGVAASFALAAKAADAQSSPAPKAPDAPPSPAPSASPKPPSAAALATAAAFRRFDPKLTDAEIETIARGIDGNAAAGARINPKNATYLKNGDEPVTRFAASPAR